MPKRYQITPAQAAQLRKEGYTDEQIRRLADVVPEVSISGPRAEPKAPKPAEPGWEFGAGSVGELGGREGFRGRPAAPRRTTAEREVSLNAPIPGWKYKAYKPPSVLEKAVGGLKQVAGGAARTSEVVARGTFEPILFGPVRRHLWAGLPEPSPWYEAPEPKTTMGKITRFGGEQLPFLPLIIGTGGLVEATGIPGAAGSLAARFGPTAARTVAEMVGAGTTLAGVGALTAPEGQKGMAALHGLAFGVLLGPAHRLMELLRIGVPFGVAAKQIGLEKYGAKAVNVVETAQAMALAGGVVSPDGRTVEGIIQNELIGGAFGMVGRGRQPKAPRGEARVKARPKGKEVYVGPPEYKQPVPAGVVRKAEALPPPQPPAVATTRPTARAKAAEAPKPAVAPEVAPGVRNAYFIARSQEITDELISAHGETTIREILLVGFQTMTRAPVKTGRLLATTLEGMGYRLEGSRASDKIADLRVLPQGAIGVPAPEVALAAKPSTATRRIAPKVSTGEAKPPEMMTEGIRPGETPATYAIRVQDELDASPVSPYRATFRKPGFGPDKVQPSQWMTVTHETATHVRDERRWVHQKSGLLEFAPAPKVSTGEAKPPEMMTQKEFEAAAEIYERGAFSYARLAGRAEYDFSSDPIPLRGGERHIEWNPGRPEVYKIGQGPNVKTIGFYEARKRYIERALEAGRPVIAGWEADYPDLAAKYGKAVPETGTIVPKEGTEGGTPSYGQANTVFKGDAADAALGRVKSRVQGPLKELRGGGPSTQELLDWITIGGYHIEAGLREFPRWAAEMVEVVGERVKPHLQRIWKEANRRWQEGYAANINLRRMAVSKDAEGIIWDDVKRLSEAGTLGKARGGIQSWEKQLREAKTIPELTVDDIQRVGQRIKVNRELTTRLGMEVKGRILKAEQARRDYDANPTDALLIEWARAEAERDQLVAGLSGARAEAGRSLNILKAVLEATEGPIAKRPEAINRIKKLVGEFTEEERAAYDAIPQDDTQARFEFLRRKASNRLGTGDKFYLTWISSLMSGIRTPGRNVSTNIVLEGLFPAERGLRGLWEYPVAWLQRRPRQHFPREAIPAFVGLFHGVPRGVAQGLQIMRRGYTPEMMAKWDVRGEFAAGIWDPRNWPLRLAAAGDAPFYASIEEGAYWAEATAQGMREGLRGKPLAARVAELLNNRPEELMKRAQAEAEERTFRGEPSPREKALDNLVRATPGLRYILPFRRTMYRLMRQGYKRTLFGLADLTVPEIRGTAAASDVLAKATMGTAILTGAAIYAARGGITGPAPRDPARRAAYMRTKKPWSIRIGNRWFSYRWLGPIGYPFAAAASFFDRFAQEGKEPTEEQIARAGITVGRYALEASFMQGLAGIFEAMTEGEGRPATRLATGTAKGFVWPSGLLRNIAQSLDPKVRDSTTFYNAIRADVPFLSKTVPAKLGTFGEEIERKGGTGLMAFLPESAPPATVDPVTLELNRLGIYPGYAARTLKVGDQKIQLTDDQWRDYQREVGPAIRGAVVDQLTSPDYLLSGPEEAESMVRRAIARARRDATARYKDTLRPYGAQ